MTSALRRSTARSWLWAAAAVVGLALTGAHFLFPAESLEQVVIFDALALAAGLAILVGVVVFRPAAKVAWILIGLSQLAWFGGELAWELFERVFGIDPYPSFADVLYIAGYPLFAVGLLMLLRRRSPGGDWASLIDASILTIGFGAAAWIYLVVPYASDAGTTLTEQIVTIAYPLLDVLLIAVLARLVVAAGRWSWAQALLALGVAVTLVGDIVFGLQELGAGYVGGDPVDAAWMAGYVLVGVSALHPSMRDLGQPVPFRHDRLSWRQLAVLVAASLVAPSVLALQAARGADIDVPVIVGATIAMFVLVAARLALLMRSHERARGRALALRDAGAGLVAAAGPEQLYQAALRGAMAVLPSGWQSAGNVRVVIAVGVPADGLSIAADSWEDDGTPDTPTSLNLPDPMRNALLAGEQIAGPGFGALGVEDDLVLATPILARDGRHTVLFVSCDGDPGPELRDALEALCSQVALAVEGAALVEELHVRQSEARFRSLVQNASEVIAIVDSDLTITYQTPSIKSVFGYDQDALAGSKIADLVHPDDVGQLVAFVAAARSESTRAASHESRVRHRDGSWLHVEVAASDLTGDPNVGGIVLTLRDVTQRRQLEDELAHQAFHDSLTGLANRALFEDRVRHAFARRSRYDEIAVLFVDVDDFKTVNDSLGHAAGDDLLIQIAARVGAATRVGDTCARLGGDEFALLLEEVPDTEYAVQVAERIVESLEEPFRVEDRDVFARASIGITTPTVEDIHAENLLRNADVAMYRAKAAGSGSYEIFEPSMHVAAVDRLELKGELEQALQRAEFVLHYQPIVSVETNAITAVEALVRWEHPERGLIPPGDFIELTEETGLIVPLGLWILEEACSQLRRWHDGAPDARALQMSVNLSGRQLYEPSLVDDVAEILRRCEIAPEALMLEITESALVRDTTTAVRRLQQLKALGVKIAIDDFGTGYSSLSYLKSFPVDILKIPKEFIDSIASKEEDSSLTNAILGLGGTLDLDTVAEGVETADQLDQLGQLGCRRAQGYHFAKPLPPEALRHLLTVGLTGPNGETDSPEQIGSEREQRAVA